MTLKSFAVSSHICTKCAVTLHTFQFLDAISEPQAWREGGGMVRTGTALTDNGRRHAVNVHYAGNWMTS